MMKFAVFLLVLVAVVNSDEEGKFLAGGDGDEGEGNFLVGGDEGEGNFLAGGNKGEGNFLAGGDEGEGGFIADSVDGDYFMVTRDVLYDPTTEKEIELPTRFTRLSLNVGSICKKCWLLFRSDTGIGGISGMVRTQEISYSRPRTTIYSMKVFPIGGTADSIKVQGGVGTNYALIIIKSKPSQGFAYRIQIHGR